MPAVSLALQIDIWTSAGFPRIGKNRELKKALER